MREIETGTPTVLARVEDAVGVITLNRPERRNALHPDMYDAIPALIERFLADDEVGCILITGEGSAFCAGGDVREGRPRPAAGEVGPTLDAAANALTHNARMVLQLHESTKISIAALPGPAVGAGLAIALAADLRMAAASTRLITGWGALAFSGDFGGTWFLTRLLGPARALEALVDGEPIAADEALRLGLVNRVVPDEELTAEAMGWARRIARGPSTAQRFFKANVHQAMHLGLREALPLESDRMARTRHTEEHRAAVRAWMERRSPR